MRSYEERAKDFIKEFYPYVSSCTTHFQRRTAVAQYNMEKHRKVIFCHGMTRLAFVTSDYVVKIDYGDCVKTFGGGEKEIELYEKAVEDNMEYLFAKISRFEYNGTRFYIMPRISGIGRTDWDAWDYMTDEERDWCIDHDLFDLHYNNYGWKDNHIVIIDYGAYGD